MMGQNAYGDRTDHQGRPVDTGPDEPDNLERARREAEEAALAADPEYAAWCESELRAAWGDR